MNWLPLSRASTHLILAQSIVRRLREPSPEQSWSDYRAQITGLLARIEMARECIDEAEQVIERSERIEDRGGYWTTYREPWGHIYKTRDSEHPWVAGPIGPSGRPEFFCRDQEEGR